MKWKIDEGGDPVKGNVEKLLPLFGSNKELADIAKVDKSAVIRWRQGRHKVAPVYQQRIWDAAKRRNLPEAVVCKALGIPKCPHCKQYHIVK